MNKCVGIGKITLLIGCQLLDTGVLPILDYAADICKGVQTEEIEIIHLRFIKVLLGVKQGKSTDVVYTETEIS